MVPCKERRCHKSNARRTVKTSEIKNKEETRWAVLHQRKVQRRQVQLRTWYKWSGICIKAIILRPRQSQKEVEFSTCNLSMQIKTSGVPVISKVHKQCKSSGKVCQSMLCVKSWGKQSLTTESWLLLVRQDLEKQPKCLNTLLSGALSSAVKELDALNQGVSLRQVYQSVWAKKWTFASARR